MIIITKQLERNKLIINNYLLGLKYKDICKLCNCKNSTIYRILKLNSIPLRECITWNKGLTKETDNRMKKLVENHKYFSGEKNPMFGKTRSIETRNKISIANKGKKHNPCSNERKIKIGLANKGHKHSILSKIQLSETRKRLFKEGKLKSWNEGLSKENNDKLMKSSVNMINNNPMKNENTCKKVSNTLKKLYKSGIIKQIFPLEDTKIELKIQSYLRQLGIEYFTHFRINEIEHSYRADILIPVQNKINQKIIIECDGDFFHCNPKKYSADYVRFPNSRNKRIAKDIWERDNIRTKELQKKGFRVLRFWESEINKMDLITFKENIEIINKDEILL